MGTFTALFRRFRLFWHKPRHWALRPGTIDRRLFREVVIRNDYRLPARFAPGDVVLDVGAHTGSFALAALRRGAGAVWCCEADPANFALLERNLRPYRDRLHLLHGAVWRSDRAVADLPFHNPGDPRNTGACQVADHATGLTVPALAFDELVARATGGGARRVRLLKLDCEGAEWPILFTSRMLRLVDAVCGEYHLGATSEAFEVPGHAAQTPAELARHLGEQGLRVHAPPPAPGGQFGLFFAERAVRAAEVAASSG